MSAGYHTVHVRVNDAATGQPTPVRIRFTGPDGTYYAPLGRLTRFCVDMDVAVGGNVLIGSEQYAYIDGTCEIRLPVGAISVEVSKGPEYRPVRTDVTLAPGKLALRFELERWTDLRKEDWYSGDTRSHSLTPHAALLEGAGEGLAVVNLLADETLIFGYYSRQYPTIPNILAFSGQRPALEMPGHQVVVNTMNRHPRLGRLLLLNCHRVVYPLTFGGPEGWDNWSLADWCDQCHRKGGLVIGDGFFGSYPGHAHGELLADLILGKVDALELNDFENPDVDAKLKQESELRPWYWLLDSGFRIPLVAGSGKASNLGVLGEARTYARLQPGKEFTYKGWIEAIRAGRTFVTNGPLLRFQVDDQDPGAVIDLPSTGSTVRVRAEVCSIPTVHHLEVIANHTVVARAEASGSPAYAALEADVSLPAGGWLLARCWGPYDDRADQWIAAQTSPVYVQVEGRVPRANPGILARFIGQLDKLLQWVEQEGRFENDRQREHLAGIFQEARQELLRRQGG